MEYAIDKLEDLGLRKLAEMVLEKEEEISDLKEEIQELKADYGNKAQVERDLLQQRIEKSIEHINNCKKYRNTPYTVQEKILLEILKGDNNE